MLRTLRAQPFISLLFVCTLKSSLGWTAGPGLLRCNRALAWNWNSQQLRKCPIGSDLWRNRLRLPTLRPCRAVKSAVVTTASMIKPLPPSEDPFFAELLTDDGLRMSETAFRWQRVNWGGLLLSTFQSGIMRRVRAYYRAVYNQ